MVKQSTFFITVVVIVILWIISLIGMSFYYENKIKEVLQEKEDITILQDIEQQNEDAGLENVVVEWKFAKFIDSKHKKWYNLVGRKGECIIWNVKKVSQL